MGSQSLISALIIGGEIEQLRLAVQQLMVSNAEKEQQLEQLRLAMEQQYRYGRYGSGPSSGASGSGEEVIIGSIPRSVSGYGTVSEETTTAGEFDLNQQLRKLLAVSFVFTIIYLQYLV